jgi:hypothetical protein
VKFLYQISVITEGGKLFGIDELIWKLSDKGFIIEFVQITRKKNTKGVLELIEFNSIYKEYDDETDQRGEFTLNSDDWIIFNNVVNDWADGTGLNISVKSATFVIRTRNKRRVSFVAGDYHGAETEWR